jgi:Flp pilus assembly protein TadG
MRGLASLCRRFRSDQRGALSVETVIIMPLLLWTLMACFVFWDAFRTRNTHMKAAHAVTDMLSREMTAIDTAYINGMHAVFRYMTRSDRETWMRVTSVRYRADDDSYRVLWSRTTNAAHAPQHTDASLVPFRPRIPLMANDDTIIIVETWQDYEPLFNVGIGQQVMSEFIVTRPRWLSPIPLTS